MTNFVPIFPLSIVVFPGEQLNLHIFEPRYKQLVNECFEERKRFGIPTVITDKVSEFGTTVMVKDIVKVYDSGEMDITAEGDSVFRMLELVKDIPDKLYSGAIVNYQENQFDGNRQLMQALVRSIRELHDLLKVQKKFTKEDLHLVTYDIAHHVGFSLEEEYEFLQLPREIQRQEYIKRHLGKVLPLLAEMEALKDKIKLNGHFKQLPGFNF
ncbi:MAG TPA: LON peptidase substrate-binding domain-containing protein [Dinghuibacter sp.]|jgi:Lon protease-like protein|uniref:LON peptidase substrate-binding domain-containing protein n=1 Tax=Dinghuibacter sp. TaxID=2024697 RepID=UPI002B7DB1B1|nr:LON peptidase substrate-binding domain-containing protein [Dinghuibacter sp.]HTJ13936.1 LON peptidase substrate-binding domain-containing protein [Dinghuibacter sp.]